MNKGGAAGSGAGAAAGAVTGVAAGLQARENQLYDTIETLQAKLTTLTTAQDTAFATLAPLQARLVALRKANPGEQSADAATLALEVSAAEIAFNLALGRVNDCRAAIKLNYERLKSQKTAPAQGAISPYVVVQQHLSDEHLAAAAEAAILRAESIRIVALNFDLKTALEQLSSMNSAALAAAFPFKAGVEWHVGPIRILIRDHFPALFHSMCRKANVHNMGVDGAKGGHALLRGTAGTGKTYFMLVMFIQFLKMMRAASTVREEAFTGAVTSILIKWDQLSGGADLLFDASEDHSSQYTKVHRVHLFDAGETMVKLPGEQGDGFFLATASADPRHYAAWDSKARVAKQYSVLWSPSELLRVGQWEGIAKDELANRFAIVGGVPRLVLSYTTEELRAMVKQRLAAVSMPQVRTIIDSPHRNKDSPDDMLRGVVGEQHSFSLFALRVKPEGDFDDVQVKFLTKYIGTEFFKQARERTVAQVLGELRDAITGGSGLAGGTFEDWSVYELSKYGISGEMTVLSKNGDSTVAQLDLAPCDTIRYFMDAAHLATLVQRHGASAMYLPVAANNPLVDAWCVGTITCDDNASELVVVGCQMTVARSSHPTTGEDEAKAQFQAIQRTLPRAGPKPVAVSESPWVLWVLPAMHYRGFPFQHSKNGEVPGTVWPFRQGKIGMLLSAEGRTPKDMDSYKTMVAASTTLNLASPELDARAAAQLYNIGKLKAPKFVEAVQRCTKAADEAKDDTASANRGAASAGNSAENPCDAFLKRLRLERHGYAAALEHPRNWGQWVYQRCAPRCIDNEMEDLFDEGSGSPVKRARTHKGAGEPVTVKRPRTTSSVDGAAPML